LLEAAPLGLRDRLLELIAAETERKRQGQPARILAKMNSLVDPKLIQALYDASAAGVEIRLNVRGICCLRPEVPGLSEHITVTSIVDRFLEHSRVFHFHQGGQGRTFISSADWMPRNLDRRIELMVPIDDPDAAARLLGMLEHCLADQVKGRRLRDDGGYDVPVDCARFADGRDQLANDGSLGGRSQQLLYDQACRDIQIRKDSHREGFVPHRAPGHKTTES
jgi:polyphosphate kinase